MTGKHQQDDREATRDETRDDVAAAGADDGTDDGAERFQRGSGASGDSGDSGNLSDLAKDATHPFDQTNGIVDGLEGDADEREKVDERMGDDVDTDDPHGA